MRQTTRDPAEVRRWAEKRAARPAMGDDGTLTLRLPNHEHTASQEIGWAEFAGIFTAERLSFHYEDVLGTEDDFFAIAEEDELAAPA